MPRDEQAAGGWLREDQPEVAVGRLLDAAGRAFAEHGPVAARMEDVAESAGCSRGTVYRYFPTRDELHRAFVAREGLRLARLVFAEIADVEDPGERLVAGITSALDLVRRSSTLSCWFSPEVVGMTTELAGGSEVLRDLTAAFVDDIFAMAEERGLLRPELDPVIATEWVMRVILSLLTVEGTATSTAVAEAGFLRTFLVPSLMA